MLNYSCDSMKDIESLCEKISNKRCSLCGGSFINHSCKYCGYVDEELKDLISQLEGLVSSEPSLETLMSLNTISGLKIPFINDILDKNNFKNKLNNKFNSIISSDSLNKEDYKYLLYFINLNEYKDYKSQIIDKLIKGLCTNKIDLNNEEMYKLIKSFSESLLSNITNNPICKFDDLGEEVLGSSFYNYIRFDKTSVNELINEKKYIDLLELIFHECSHSYQKYYMNKGYATFFTLMQSKESVISHVLGDYYNENYYLYSDEIDARISGMNMTINYLNSLGVEIPDEYLKNYKDSIEKDKRISMNQNRLYKGEVTTIDELFIKVINSVNNKKVLLQENPSIFIEYKVVDGVVVKKSKEELLELYNGYKSGIYQLNGSKEEIDYLFNHLLNNLDRERKM